MDAIGVKNFRSLKDTGLIDIKPITILLGKNSSGKSTLLRLFPLLRQSVEIQTKGPLAFFGNLVDFGDFSTALYSEAKDKFIELDFQGEATNFPYRFYGQNFYHFRYYYSGYNRPKNFYYKCKLKIISDKSKKMPRVDEVELNIGDNNIKITIEKENKIKNIYINDSDYSPLENKPIMITDKGFIPLFGHQEIPEKTIAVIEQYLYSSQKNTGKAAEIIFSVPLTNSAEMLKKLLKLKVGKTWLKSISHWDEKNEDFHVLRDAILATRLCDILKNIDCSIIDVSKEVMYSAPLRATAARYYRPQDFITNEVSFDGKNLPVFLDNLSDKNKKSFNDWTDKHFGFKCNTDSNGGHISLVIEEKGQKIKTNLVDNGFGYSQIVPIITQLWSIFSEKKQTEEDSMFYIEQKKEKKIITVAIEQPELHLHPALQAKLAKNFASIINVAKKMKITLRIIIETHSEVILNTFGRMIAKKEFDESLINIVKFEKKYSNNSTMVSTTSFDEDGFFRDFPTGFLSPDLED
jgi:AAA ATPase domain